MFHASKWTLLVWIIITLTPTHNVHAKLSDRLNPNVDIYSLFHEDEQPHELVEAFHIELNRAPLIEAHIYMTDQQEPYNNPIRMEVILSCEGQTFYVNREDRSRSLKTFCDFSPPQVVTSHQGKLENQKVLQMLLFQFDESEGQCASTPNVQETLPVESIIKLCQSLE